MSEGELSYKDITLIPRKCVVPSREHCDPSVVLGGRKFTAPVYPANMKSVVNFRTCEYMASRNWFYTMHRFGVNNLEFVLRMHKIGLFASISVGINGDSIDELKAIKDGGLDVEYVTIDVANAWSDKTAKTIDWIRTNLPKTFLIVGNVATAEAVEDLQSWGAQAVKVGIAGGKVCITRNKTGFHRPMVSTILDCVSVAKVPIIADGGVEEHGDVAKALVCGATMVMAGYMFAGYYESAGDIFEIDGKRYKQYFGSASKYNKKEQKNIEGKKILIDYRGKMGPFLDELFEDLQSSISYAGGNTLDAFKTVEYKIIK